MFQSPGPIALNLGPLSIHWYGILIGLAIVICYSLIILEAKRRKLDTKHIENMAFWLVLGGVVGARLYFVIFNLDYFIEFPLDIFKTWKGGLAIHGALIGGAAAYFIYVFRSHLKWTLYADLIMPGILLAQGIGRFGNFFNNEAFGTPTDLPWKLFIPVASRPQGFEQFMYFQPTFLYESLWNFLGFALLFVLARKIYPASSNSKHTGYIFFTYLIWYSIGRFFIEAMRLDSLYLGPLRAAQVASVCLFIFGCLGLLFLLKKTKITTR